MTDALASHYARALRDAVFAENSNLAPDQALAQLDAITSLISGSRDWERVLLSPAIKQGRKLELVSKLADQLRLHRLLKNFLVVVVRHRRIRDLRNIQEEFAHAVDEQLGYVRAEIISANELAKEQRIEIERALAQTTGKSIRPQYKVDAGLIGGLIARVGAREYDGSLRSKLDSLRRRLVAAQ